MELKRVQEILFNRWVSLLVGLVVESVSGTMYVFSVWSPSLQTKMGYTDKQINFIGTCANWGVYLGFIPGVFYDLTGPRWTCLLGAVLYFAGYFSFYLGATATSPTNYLIMGGLMFVAGNGSAATYTSALATNIPKFSAEHRAKVVGLLVSLFGLSSAIFSQIYHFGFESNVTGFFLFLAICLPAVALLGVVFLSPLPQPKQASEFDINTVFSSEVDDGAKEAGSGDIASDPPQVEVNFLVMFTHLKFWMLFLAFLAGSGAGLVVINNIGKQTIALGGKNGDQDLLVTLLSLCNCAGRLLAGVISDLAQPHVSPVVLLSSSILFMGVSVTYLAFVQQVVWLYPGVVCAGLAYGAIFSIMPSLIYKFFGGNHFGGNLNVVMIAPAIGSFLFATLLAGSLCQNCTGRDRYLGTFCIMGGICICGWILCLLLELWLQYEKQRASMMQQEVAEITASKGTGAFDVYAAIKVPTSSTKGTTAINK